MSLFSPFVQWRVCPCPAAVRVGSESEEEARRGVLGHITYLGGDLPSVQFRSRRDGQDGKGHTPWASRF